MSYEVCLSGTRVSVLALLELACAVFVAEASSAGAVVAGLPLVS